MAMVWANTPVIKPNAKERLANAKERAAEVERQRPCSKCINSSRYTMENRSYMKSGCSGCNFNHDNFKPQRES